jgi:ABC-type sulfate transport system permease component
LGSSASASSVNRCSIRCPLIAAGTLGETDDGRNLRGLVRAANLIWTADPAVLEIICLSLIVTGLALAISTLIGVPAGAVLGLWSRIRVRGLITVLMYTGMGLPPVVVGLAVYLLLSRSGPLGSWAGCSRPAGWCWRRSSSRCPWWRA